MGMMALSLPGIQEGEEGQFGIALAQEYQVCAGRFELLKVC